MLRSFRVANHKSIRDEQELVLLPAYDKARPVVPVAAIFGANASGKSNLLDALAFMQTAVRTSFGHWEARSGVPRTPFKLDAKSLAAPSFYAVDLWIEGVQYAYGFTLDSEQVLEEWLYSYPHRRKRVIFERDRDAITFGSTVPDYRGRAEIMSGLTRDNALLLSAAAQANQDVVTPVYDWFRRGVIFASGRAATRGLDGGRVRRALKTHPGIVDLVRAADLGITEIQVLSPTDNEPALLVRLGDAERRLLDSAFALKNLEGQVQHLQLKDPQAWKAAAAQTEQLREEFTRHQAQSQILRRALRESWEIHFLHGEQQVPLRVDDQSDGTVAWVRLLIDALDVLADGTALVVDEIDSSLHPHLSARLVALFQDVETNPKSAQLIFTTHDATLLSPSLGDEALNRDEVWFIEKQSEGASKLYPLTDFHPRQGESIARRYLGGSYGAIPATSEYAFRRAVINQAGDAAA